MAMLLCPTISAQAQVDAIRAAEILQQFSPQANAALACEFTPVKPSTTFTFNLPDVPETVFSAEVAAAFLVGEGHYQANAILFDDSHRTCRADWQVEMKGAGGYRVASLPNSVAAISEGASWAPTSDAPIERMTVFLHVAPLNARLLNLQASDSVMALASLMALLEPLPARAVRLVVFNLHREKELITNKPKAPMAEAIDSLPGSVASDPDVIAGFVRGVRGKVFVVRNPGDFAKAVESINRATPVLDNWRRKY